MSLSNLSSYIIPETPETATPPELQDEIDSLPSSDTDSSYDDYERRTSDADREWRESLQQLELFLTLVIVPYVGKYFGRKCAYWGWARFMEWKYPVEVKITSPNTFRAAGMIEAAASL